MDTIVARYRRPAFRDPDQLDDEDYSGSLPGLSHKFALPPIAQVGPPSIPPLAADAVCPC